MTLPGAITKYVLLGSNPLGNLTRRLSTSTYLPVTTSKRGRGTSLTGVPVSNLCGSDGLPPVSIVNTVALDARSAVLTVCSCLTTVPRPLLIIVAVSYTHLTLPTKA